MDTFKHIEIQLQRLKRLFIWGIVAILMFCPVGTILLLWIIKQLS